MLYKIRKHKIHRITEDISIFMPHKHVIDFGPRKFYCDFIIDRVESPRNYSIRMPVWAKDISSYDDYAWPDDLREIEAILNQVVAESISADLDQVDEDSYKIKEIPFEGKNNCPSCFPDRFSPAYPFSVKWHTSLGLVRSSCEWNPSKKQDIVTSVVLPYNSYISVRPTVYTDKKTVSRCPNVSHCATSQVHNGNRSMLTKADNDEWRRYLLKYFLSPVRDLAGHYSSRK